MMTKVQLWTEQAQAWNIIRDSLVAVQALHLSRWMEIGALHARWNKMTDDSGLILSN